MELELDTKQLNLNDSSGFSIDLGIRAFISQINNYEYGFRVISTFNSESTGEILKAEFHFTI